MKILSIGYALEKASGVTTFVERTAEELRRSGHAVDIVDALKTDVRAVDVSRYDIVHFHCLWQLHKYAKSAFFAGVPVVWSTHGMAAPWAMRHKWWKKQLAWLLFQKRDLKKAAAIHCTTEQEVAWNEAHGLKNCFIAPLGTTIDHLPTTNDQRLTTNDPLPTTKTLLFVGRIHPVKGLENLIKAWGIVKNRGGDGAEEWKLRIVGPDEGGYLSRLKAFVSSLSLESSVEFPGARFGDELDMEYSSCDCLVLPSFTENFGAAVVDAMAHGKPVIASTFTPWREVAGQGCGWHVSNDPPALAKAISSMAALSDSERAAMGERGRALAQRRYAWPAVAEKLAGKYKELVGE